MKGTLHVPKGCLKGHGVSRANYKSGVQYGGDVHEIYTIKYSHIYIFSLTFMLFCDLGNKGFTCKVRLGQLNQTNLNLAMMKLKKFNPIKFKSNWSKESKEICTKSKSNSD